MRPFSRLPNLRLVGGALGLLIVTATGLSAAQTTTLPILAWPGVTQDDLTRMHAAAARLYEGRSIGTVERWRSPSSKDAGEVTLVSSFDSHGMPCRTVDYTIRFEVARDAPDHYELTWCQVSPNTWKIVELPVPR